jgi:hypothetical protein
MLEESLFLYVPLLLRRLFLSRNFNTRTTMNLIFALFFFSLLFLVVDEQGNKSDPESTEGLEKYNHEISQ